ncbi:ABC transporter ATP-binding protein [uncultured Clostridium sp.]|uniref:ABC transporter ATP-binding protein n=1 Tax=uncultured Clostridium sp. TaxID=59620 RepID=UPI0026078C4A|nr:ABC transporter ATP-binding protein [uncultured Clostridium sp.]
MKLYFKDVIGIPFRYAKFEAFIILVQRLFSGFVPMIQMFLVTDFVNKAVAILNGKMGVDKIYLSIFMLVSVVAIDWLFAKVILFASTSMSLKIKKGYRVEITRKVASLKYSYIESEDTWNLIERTTKDIEIRLRDAYLNLLNLISLILKITGVLVVLLTYSITSVIIMFAVCVPFFILSVKSGNKAYEVEKEVAKERRKSDYIGATLTSREAAYERNLFSYGNTLSDKWQSIYEHVRKKEADVNVKWIYRAKLGSIITSIAVILTIIVFLFPLASGGISIGNFVAIGNGTMGLINDMSWTLSSFIKNVAFDMEYFKDLREMAGLEEEKGSLDLREESLDFKTLEFRNVSFKYDGCENYIFKNLSLKIENGKHYSIVGANGCGKTTITKLITGLYSNFEGDILINDKSIKEYTSGQIKSLTALVYQDFAKYYMSIKENIEVGNINKLVDTTHLEEIENAIDIIGLKDFIASLDDGIATELGKVKEDSIDLSGGQWQRIAMARAMVSDASLRILDEPTSALDPISESKVYESFEDISKGKTTIFISHRLGSTKICDKIFVINDGMLAEEGSHEQLISLDGVYANMYESQKEWYAC